MRDCPFQTTIEGELSCLFGIAGEHRTTQEICSSCSANTLPNRRNALNACPYLNLRLSISIEDKQIVSKAHCLKKGRPPDCSYCRNAVPIVAKGVVSAGRMDVVAHAFLTKKEKLYQKLAETLAVGRISAKCFISGDSCSKKIEMTRNTIFVALADTTKVENAYQFGIKPALDELGLKPWRAREEKLNIDVMCTICELIQTAEYVLADLSAGRVTVGYELGIAHGLGKETFIIRDGEDIEVSDLKRNEMILYDDYHKLKEEFVQIFSDAAAKLRLSSDQLSANPQR